MAIDENNPPKVAGSSDVGSGKETPSPSSVSELSPPSLQKPQDKPEASTKVQPHLTFNIGRQPSDHSMPASRPMEDPSVPFVSPAQSIEPGWLRSLKEDSNLNAEKLRKSGTLCISCAHSGMLTQAQQAIIESSHFIGFQARVLYTDLQDSVPIRQLLQPGGYERINQSQPGKLDGTKVVLFVDVSEPAAFRSLEKCAGPLTNPTWSEKSIFLVFCLQGKALEGAETATLERKISFWKIDPLCRLLSAGSESEAKVERLVPGLSAARKRNWAGTEEGFLEKVEDAFLRNGLDGVRVWLTQLEAIDPNIELANSLALWKKGGLLERAALFVALYFPESSLPQFELLIETLLTGVTMEASRDAKPNQPEEEKKGAAIKAVEQWRIEQERILETTQLQYHRKWDGQVVVNFSKPVLFQEIKNSISPSYALTQFNRLHSAGLLMRLDSPKPIVRGLIELTAEMITAHPDTYNAHWLLDRVADINIWRLQFAESIAAGEASPQQREQSLKQWLQVIGGHLLAHFYTRLAELCRGLVSNTRTQDVTRRFLTLLINETQPIGMHAVEVIRRLPGESAYDPYPHLRHLCEVGDWNTCYAVLRLNLDRMEESNKDCLEVLERVWEWLPPPDLPKEKKMSRAQICGLILPYFAFTDYSARCKAQRFRNRELPSLRLFAPGDDLAQRIKWVAEWISHPLFCTALKAVHDEVDNQNSGDDYTVSDFEALRAEMLEEWQWLSGSAAVEQLAKEAVIGLKTKEQVNLRVLLRQRGDALLAQISCASGLVRRELLLRRRRAYALSACCKSGARSKKIST